MLGHRLRRWPSIKATLGQRLVFAGLFADSSSYVRGEKVDVYTGQVTTGHQWSAPGGGPSGTFQMSLSRGLARVTSQTDATVQS